MKKILKSCILSIAVFALLSFSAFAAEMIFERAQSGFCGVEAPGKKLLTWSLDDEGTLTISGSGDMKNYASHKDVPWYSSRAYIQKLSISEGVTSISDYAFMNCPYLSAVNLPTSVKHIGYSAFSQCSRLTQVNIPSSITSIADYAFSDCKKLEAISVPSNVEDIGNYAFSRCSALLSVDIAEGVKTIGNNAFESCTKLTSITIPASVTSIGNFAFNNCHHLKAVWVDSENCNYSSDEQGVLFNKDKTELILYPRCKTEKSYTIPSSVKIIGDSAFSACTNLRSVTIPTGVTSIGASCFASCDLIYAFHIPASVTSIGNEAFRECERLTAISVDSQNEYYSSDEHGALFDKDKTVLIQYPACNTAENYTIPSSVKSIGSYAFCDCIYLTSVSVPTGVTSIGIRAFADCAGLVSINIPVGVTKIEGSLFSGCRSLESVNIPIGVTCIDSFAFYECTSLTSVTIPSSVTSIGDGAFFDCYYLKDVYYTGTEADWKNIFIDSYDNSSRKRATIHYNAPMLAVSVSQTVSGTAYTVSAENIPTLAVIVVALYHKGRFVGFEQAEYRREAVVIETETVHDSAKIMAWESMKPLSPLALRRSSCLALR